MFDTDGSGAIGSEELKGAMLRVSLFIFLFILKYNLNKIKFNFILNKPYFI